jgi:medium-chain acyl-[acyl-carrier-protein] hydrolase
MPLPSPEAGVFRQTFPIHYPDADATGVVRATAVLNALQTVAGNHTESRGFSYRERYAEGVFWVLSRLVVRFDAWPAWPLDLAAETWARSTRAVFALRDYRFGPTEGPWSGHASSAWVILKDRKPQRPEPWVSIYEKVSPCAPLAEMPAALPALETSGDGAGDVTVHTTPVHADWEDVDMNGHVNNVSAVGWCLAQQDFAFLSRWRPETLEANFLAEMFCDQDFEIRRVAVAGAPGTKTYDYAVVRPADGVVTLRLRIAFRPSA